jgi:hypothetical protein
MMVEESERKVCVISWIEDVISYSVRMICSPTDTSFDVVWKVVFCSSGDSG